MRFVLATMAAALILGGVGVLTTTSDAAAQKKQVTRATVNQCIDLARKRGYTESDLDGGGSGSNPARQFVIRCLQGKAR
jgi:hypothetical protein